MALVIPEGNGQFRVEYSIPGQSGQVMNIIGYEDSTASDATSSLGRFLTVWENIMDQLSDDCVLLGGTAIQAGPGGVFTEASAGSGEPGGQAGVPVIPNTCVLVKKITGFAGRQNRGRLYVPGIPDSVVDTSGDIDLTWLSNFNSDLNNAVTALDAVDLRLSILHDDEGPYADDPPAVVTSLLADGRVATQRQRLRD